MDEVGWYDGSRYPVRADLAEVHRVWIDHVADPGTWWTGPQRVAFVEALWAALDDPEPLAPWTPPSQVAGRVPAASPLPPAAHDLAYRLARHAATTSLDWYERMVEALGGPAAYVELAALAATGVAVGSFAPALGLTRPPLPAGRPGRPDGPRPELRPATLNWVPVAGEPDSVAAVVQALSAVPVEHELMWRLAEVQYMADAEMVHLDWRRPGSPLHRRQLELVAARLSLHRECFY